MFQNWLRPIDATLVVLAVVLVAACAGCNERKPIGANLATSEKPPTVVQSLVSSEELIHRLTKELRHLNRDIQNLKVPSSFSEHLFSEQIKFNNVDFKTSSTENSIFIAPTKMSVEPQTQTVSRDEFRLWPEFLADVEYFSLAKFYFVSAEFESDKKLNFHSNMGFKATAKMNDNSWQSVKCKLKVIWNRKTARSDEAWKIVEIKTEQFLIRRSQNLLFRECLAEFCGETLAEKMRFSQHTAYVRELVSTGQLKMKGYYLSKYFQANQGGQHPGICAVDINNDGWDDLYICDEWIPNKLLINDGGNGFYEAAKEYGLDVDLPTTSAIFVDIDNDGDKDAFVARYFEDSKLLVNEDGIFVDRSDNLPAGIPKMISSVSATDFNNDGLIDLYLGTYGFSEVTGRFDNWKEDFLSPDDIRRYYDTTDQQDAILNAFGPSNLLLQNMGGTRFEKTSQNSFIDNNYNTFQAVWSDYDLDGDQDLYLSNDYAKDMIFRNDNGSFVDVTFEIGGSEMMGFGMGASFGDFDADGDLDLYVSNMYSKAGTRILRQIPGVDSNIHLTANGNRLYKMEDGKLVCQPGTNDNAAIAGWSWGGMFTDFDNNGLLDIYVASGFFTSPFDDERSKDL